MKQIKTIADIQLLLTHSFSEWQSLGCVSVKSRGDLMLFNYTPRAQFEARWNFFEQVSRGLILNTRTGEIVARPFDKFFNWGEGNRFSAAPIKLVTEKMDGSLGILYREDGRYKIATRGSFDSEQAIWATEFLGRQYDLTGLTEDATLLFEIIYPGNRVVVDYQEREDLVLLAARNRFTGQYDSWSMVENIANTFGFSLPKVYQFNNPSDILSACEKLPSNSEGWVVEFDDGQRFKFKGEEYRKLHKLISGLSFNKTLECVANDTTGELRSIVPDEFLGEVNAWIEEIETTVRQVKQDVARVFSIAPKSTRKEFALWVMQNYKPLAPYMFAQLDGRPVEPLIYKMAFVTRTSTAADPSASDRCPGAGSEEL